MEAFLWEFLPKADKPDCFSVYLGGGLIAGKIEESLAVFKIQIENKIDMEIEFTKYGEASLELRWSRKL